MHHAILIDHDQSKGLFYGARVTHRTRANLLSNTVTWYRDSIANNSRSPLHSRLVICPTRISRCVWRCLRSGRVRRLMPDLVPSQARILDHKSEYCNKLDKSDGKACEGRTRSLRSYPVAIMCYATHTKYMRDSAHVTCQITTQHYRCARIPVHVDHAIFESQVSGEYLLLTASTNPLGPQRAKNNHATARRHGLCIRMPKTNEKERRASQSPRSHPSTYPT